MQLVLGNWANFQLQVSLAIENQLHKTVAKFSNSVRPRTLIEVGLVIILIAQECLVDFCNVKH
jgi:hypothetical protein